MAYRLEGVSEQTDGPPGVHDFSVYDEFSGPYKDPTVSATRSAGFHRYTGAFAPSEQWVAVYAGRAQSLDGTPGGGGELYIQVEPADPAEAGPVTRTVVPAPMSPSWVRIDSVQGTLVNLSRADGTSLSYDLATGKFI